MKPVARFEIVPVGRDEQTKIIGVDETKQIHWLHPKLLGFAVLSIILGLTINAMIPGREPGLELLASVIIIFIYWVNEWVSFTFILQAFARQRKILRHT